uniref:Uncharacterized protein n=1 Tax=Ascaris lumbricoides TaxID=6252 RepID=A0A9J2PJ97_ASCLU
MSHRDNKLLIAKAMFSDKIVLSTLIVNSAIVSTNMSLLISVALFCSLIQQEKLWAMHMGEGKDRIKTTD